MNNRNNSNFQNTDSNQNMNEMSNQGVYPAQGNMNMNGMNQMQGYPNMMNMNGMNQKPKKKKGKGCLIAVAAVIVLGIVFGGSGDSDGDKKDKEVKKDSSSVTNKAEDKDSSSKEVSLDDIKKDFNELKEEIGIGDKKEDKSSKDDKKKDKDKDKKDEKKSETANEVVYDDGSVKITYTGYEASKFLTSAKLKFLIENNTSDNITIENFDLNINGFTLTTWFYEDIPAGKKTNAEMSISSTQLDENSIDSIGTIDLSFRCINSDTFKELFTTNSISIIFDETVSTEENIDDYQLICSGADVEVYFKDYGNEGFLTDGEFKFLVINNSGEPITVSADNISVNDFAMTDLFYAKCAPNSKTNETLPVYISFMEDNAIKEVEKLEFTLKCYNTDTWRDIWNSEPIVISIK